MDLALTVFRIGVGVGALFIGLALLLLVFSLRGLGRDARTLSADLQRLNRLLATLTSEEPAGDAPEGQDRAREPAAHEAPSAPHPPPAPPDEAWALPPPANSDEPAAADEEVVGWWPGGVSDGPVQSADQREDERIA